MKQHQEMQYIQQSCSQAAKQGAETCYKAVLFIIFL